MILITTVTDIAVAIPNHGRTRGRKTVNGVMHQRMKRRMEATEVTLGNEDDNIPQNVNSVPTTRHGRKQHVISIKLEKVNNSSCRVNRTPARWFIAE
jgi:hypothetical protein